MHLTDDTCGRLLDGSLPPLAARALSRHLAAPCEACEAHIMACRSCHRLDGALDLALLSLAPVPAAGAGQDLEYARIVRALGPPGLAVAPG